MRLWFAWAHGVAADDCIEPLRKTHLSYERGGETLIFVGADGKLYAARMQFVHCVHESGISLTMAREIFAIIFKQHRQIFLHQFVGRSARNLKATLQHHLERSEEHTSELQSLMRISYAVFCLKKKKKNIKI